jgi:hypothetical protein
MLIQIQASAPIDKEITEKICQGNNLLNVHSIFLSGAIPSFRNVWLKKCGNLK